jgi:nucleoside-diphosphate-sugar epimerase
MSDPVVVTGGCGFIGREVATQLLARGERVRVVDDLSKPDGAAPPGAELVRADLTSPEAALEALSDAKRVVHLAAKIGGIGYFHRHPATILRENDRIYAAVFPACVERRVERLVYVSSSMVFERALSFPSAEADLECTPVPRSAYGFSKLSGEWYCRAYKDEHGLPCTIVRPFNAYGVNEVPGDEVGEAHVIPDLVWKLLAGDDPLRLLGDGEQTRCFTHVSDVARGVIMALDSPRAAGEDFNISTPEETRVLDLARALWGLLRPGTTPRFEHVPGYQDDVRRRIPAVTKARELLGFEARVRLSEGLPVVVDWLRERWAREGRTTAFRA